MNGVKTYAVATLKIFFPNNDVCCKKCPVRGKDESYGMYCRARGFTIDDLSVQGFRCPLNILAVDQTDDFEDV